MIGVAWAAGAAGASGAPDHPGAVTAARGVVAAAAPTLLATVPDDSTGFLTRPGFMSFLQNRPNRTPDYLEGPGLTQQGFEAGRQPPVVWTHWGSRAAGRATYWIGHGTSCHGCHYSPRAVSLAAWRIVEGRYTRFSITYPTGRSRVTTYELATVRVPASGVARGVPAYAWCNARVSRACSPP